MNSQEDKSIVNQEQPKKMDPVELPIENKEGQVQKTEEPEKKAHEPSQDHPRFKQIYRENKVKERTIEEQNLQIEELLMNTRRMNDKLNNLEGSYKKDRFNDEITSVEKLMNTAFENNDSESFKKLQTEYRKKMDTVHFTGCGSMSFNAFWSSAPSVVWICREIDRIWFLRFIQLPPLGRAT